MLNLAGNLKIYLAVEPADMRKGFTGLWALTVNVLKEDPTDGALFAFTNYRKNRVKLLYWDGTGMWLMTKRLEQGTFAWPKGVDVAAGKLSLRPEALALLLDGVDLRGGNLRPWYQR